MNSQPQQQHDVIAIDGGAASGKSTAARAAARSLGYVHVDSGALYRSVCWMLLKSHVDVSQPVFVLKFLPRVRLTADIQESRVHICVNGDTVEDAWLRTPEVTAAASTVAVIPEVRAIVNAQLRSLALQSNVVVEGRDIGTAVFPDARRKFYFTASAEERARRRQRDLAAMAHHVDGEKVKADLAARDHKDQSRAVDPLRTAPDAIVIDTTGHTIEQTAAEILRHLESSPSK